MYIADKRSCYMLKLAAKFGSVSDLLYIFPNIAFYFHLACCLYPGYFAFSL